MSSPTDDIKRVLGEGIAHFPVDGNFDAFRNAASALASALARGDMVRGFVGASLRSLAEGKSVDLNGAADALVLHSEPRGSAVLLMYQPREDADRIAEGDSHVAFYNPGKVGVRVAMYTPEHGYPNGEFRRERCLRDMGTIEIAPGECQFFRAGIELPNVLRPALGETAFPLVRIASARVQHFLWEYDLTTLLPVQFSNGDLSATRLQYALTLASELGDEGLGEVVEDIFEHANHTVRWDAVKTTLALSTERGKRLVQRALSDPHPHVRRAAAETIARYPEELGNGMGGVA